MNKLPLFAVLLAAATFAVVARAEEAPAPAAEAPKTAPKAETPAPEAKPETKAEAKPEAKPEAKAEPKAEAKTEAKAEPKPEAKPEPKPEPKAEAKPEVAKKTETRELTPCAKAFTPLADSYKKAYEDLQKWIADVDAQTAAATDRIQNLQSHIERNEAAITKMKIEGAGADSEKGRDLARENKQLWSDLNSARKERSTLCTGFARDAIMKAKQYQADVLEKLEAAKSSAK